MNKNEEGESNIMNLTEDELKSLFNQMSEYFRKLVDDILDKKEKKEYKYKYDDKIKETNEKLDNIDKKINELKTFSSGLAKEIVNELLEIIEDLMENQKTECFGSKNLVTVYENILKIKECAILHNKAVNVVEKNWLIKLSDWIGVIFQKAVTWVAFTIFCIVILFYVVSNIKCLRDIPILSKKAGVSNVKIIN